MVYLPIHEWLKLIINGWVNISSPMEHMGYQTVICVFTFFLGVKTQWFQPRVLDRIQLQRFVEYSVWFLKVTHFDGGLTTNRHPTGK